MRDFEIMRYLRKTLWIISALSLLGGALVYMYLSSHQSYTAQTMIEFLNPGAEEGLYPNGEEIDVNEIISSTVISNALHSLNRYDLTDSVRTSVAITEVIPDDVRQIQQSAWDSGTEYEYFPTAYVISFTSTESADAARQMLEAIIDSYISLYAEKYVSIIKVFNSAKSLQNIDYDYIEYADVLSAFVKDEIEYLNRAVAQWPTFRASTTGYSFKDLQNEFNLINSVYLPDLYKSILNERVTKDEDMLIARYHHRINEDRLELENYQAHLEKILEILESYAEKNRDNLNFHWNVKEDNQGVGKEDHAAADGDSSTADPRYVLGSVYDYGYAGGSYQETTYDKALGDYISTRTNIASLERDIEYCEYILASFEGSNGEVGPKHQQKVNDLLDRLERKLQDLDGLLIRTATEQSETETVRNVAVRSTANVVSALNMKLYTAVVIVVFFVFGCIGSILLGRGLDFLDYRLYVDPTTKLPNRAKCDMEIDKYSEMALPLPFTCEIVTIDNLNEINAKLGRENGSEVLRIFGSYLKECGQRIGFVGYNGGMQFICIFPECDENMAIYFQKILERMVGEFNDAGYGATIRYKIVYSCLSASNPCTMRELLMATMRKVRDTEAVEPGAAREQNAVDTVQR